MRCLSLKTWASNVVELKLHLCTTCRLKSRCDSVGMLIKAAKLHADRHEIQLEIEKTPCLSGCESGLMAMVETVDGMVRIKQIQTAAQIGSLLDTAEALIAGQKTPIDGQILSRLNWREWDSD